MTDRSPKEREHWTAALVPTSNCLSLEELSGYSDGSLSRSIGARVSAHLADCLRCQAELAMLREFELAVLRAEEGSAVNGITAELKRRAGEITGSSQDSRLADRAATGTEPIRWWQRVLRLTPLSAGALATGAVLVVISASLYLRNAREPALSPDAETGGVVLRSEELAVVGPAGDLERPPTALRWQAAPNAVTYTVQLMEVDKMELWKGQSNETRLTLPPEVRAKMIPGKPFLWQVSAMDAAGRPIAVSQIQRFSVTPKSDRSGH